MFSSVAGIGTNATTAKKSSYGIGGLVSGIDTSSLIKSLTASAQARIDSAMQKKQKIEWQQDSYNTIIDKLNSFKSNYFDVVGTNNLASSSAFNTWSTSSTSSAVTATSTAVNTGARLVISSVDRLASAYTVQSGSAVSGPILTSGGLDALKNKQMTFTLDGVSKTISLGDDPQAALVSAFGLSSDGTTPRVQLGAIGNMVEITASGNSKLTISGDAAVLAPLGLKSGASNRVEITNSVKSTSFATELVGESYEFTINGVDFSFHSSSSIMNVINTINSSRAGVKITYSEVDDTFTMSSKTLGTGDNITISQTKGNLLSAMLGVSASGVTSIEGNTMYTQEIASAHTDLLATDWSALAGKSFDLTIAGVTKTITLSEPDGELSDADALAAIANSFNDQIKTAFGTQAVRFAVKDSALTLVTAGYSVSLQPVDEAGEETALLDALGFAAGTSSTASADSSLSVLGLSEGGTLTLGTGADALTVEYTAETTVGELVDAINAQTAATGISASFAEGKLTLHTDGTKPFVLSDGGAFMSTMTGASSFNGAAEHVAVTSGTNAVITLEDGTVIERNTNSFTVGGVMLQINDRSDEKITITSTQDMNTVVNTMKKFVEDYNSLATTIKKLITEERFKSYAPLTDAQREDMSESQIKLWEEKARSGVLKNDMTLNGLLLDMEDILNSMAEGTGYSLEKLGFNFSVSLTEGTKLSLDEETFRTMLSQDHEGVSSFFAQPTTGFADRFASLIDTYAKSSVIDPGKLVQAAGSSVYKDGDYAKQLTELEEKITELKNKLIEQETRLWKNFSAMESALSQLNAQSSWLTTFTNTGS